MNIHIDKKAKEYILSCIDSEAYDVKTETIEEKLAFLYNTFSKEKDYEIARIGENKAFQNWIMGLPTVFNIVFYNSDIIDLAKKWGSLKKNATEKQEQKILDNYWNFITCKVFQLFKKYRIGTYKTLKVYKGS